MYRLWTILLFCTTFLLPATPVQAAAAGVEFKIDYRNGVYTVSMRPSATPQAPAMTLAAQVTIKVLHGVGDQRFMVSNVQSLVAETRWTARSRVDAPVEERSADYISFELGFPTSNFAAIHWQAGQTVKLFSFTNANACLGPLTLLENDDPFMPPNAAGTNPGNQIDILGLPAGNRYLGVYDHKQADCRNPDGIQRTAVGVAQRTVARSGAQVAIGWRTETESNVLGFNLWRQEGDVVAPLNTTLIVAQQSGMTAGAAYQVIDYPTAPDAYALYLLDVVDLAGQAERVVLGSINGSPLFLPFIHTQAHARRGQTG